MWDEDEIPQKVAEFKDSIKNTTPEAYLLEYPIETVQDILSSLIRSAIIAPKDKMLVVSDLSAIEARVLSWLAGETWRLEVFATHGKIYEASASKMFNIPMEEVTKSIRAKGKVAELALGYQGGAGALVQMGGLDMGLTLTELEGIKLLWRRNNPKIVALWKDLDDAVRTTLKSIDKVITIGVFKMRRFRVSPTLSFLQIKLPSGRSLFYANPFISQNKIGYYGLNDKKQWTKIDSYGGKFAENLTQAVARDVLAEGLMKADKKGFNINLHVHDEISIEGDEADLPTLVNLMSEPLSWAEGLPLGASGFVSSFYRK
jgi:DNA polymerase